MSLDDIFGSKEPIDLSQSTCHSGGAQGADTHWDIIGSKYGVTTKAYSFETDSHKGENKVEISEELYLEGVEQINKANHIMSRYGIHKYMNLLARNWAQVKYSKQIFAIGQIVEPGKKGDKYYNHSKVQEVNGGTGYACKMGILNDKGVWVFDQTKGKWFKWSFISEQYITCDPPTITELDFAGIGTRDINDKGIKAIKEIYKRTDNVRN